ncbi:hypothetical protein LguiA_027511 [Lonicera macranthoides]
MEEKLIQRLESAVERLEAISTGGSRSRGLPDSFGDSASSDPSVIAFEELITEYVSKVSTAAEKIGGQVLEVTKVIEQAFSVQKDLLIKIKQFQKPDMAGLAEFLKPLNEVITKATKMTEGKRTDFFNHLKSTSDSLAALAWIAYTGKNCGMGLPIPHVEESWHAAEFYNNKILVEYKNKDQNHVEWAKALKELYVPGLRDYVKCHYPLGPVWSATGKTISTQPKAPGPPAPPPASLCCSGSPRPSSSSGSKQGMAAVFQEINAGAVTSGLRKVTDDMKTKNRTDRACVVSASEKPRASSQQYSSAKAAPPPKFELQVRKWVVENHIGRKDLVISECDAKQSVYIFACRDSVLQIKGKVNNITVDKCTKMGVLFTDLVAACEVVNCNGVDVQCQGSAPTISVDNTSGCQIYLGKESLDTSITTAKATEVNIMVPGSDGDWGGHPLPQQYLHVYKDGQFVTTPTSHSGA